MDPDVHSTVSYEVNDEGVVSLLRRVTDYIESLGDVSILNAVVSRELYSPELSYKVSVYWTENDTSD